MHEATLDRLRTTLQERGTCTIGGPVTLAELCQLVDALGIRFQDVEVRQFQSASAGLIDLQVTSHGN